MTVTAFYEIDPRWILAGIAVAAIVAFAIVLYFWRRKA
jgi:preprotein translocase subunit Sec61beta